MKLSDLALKAHEKKGRSTLFSMVDKVLSRSIAPEKMAELLQEGKFRRKDRDAGRSFERLLSNYKTMEGAVLKFCKPVNQPLFLISEVQRSGGSLLAQLFDGHPQCHAHPHELKIGYPYKAFWPKLDLDGDPQHWFRKLFEDKTIKYFQRGYSKTGQGASTEFTYPFLLLPALQRRIFLDHLKKTKGKPTYRDVLNAYMTSYFNAWVNNNNIAGEKLCVTGFTPMFASHADNVKQFFEVYPDGKLVSIVRNPHRWYASAKKHGHRFSEIDQALGHWLDSARGMLRNKKNHPDRVCILRFSKLITETKKTQRTLCGFMGLKFDPCLLTPTFNGNPMVPNSSFGLSGPGITREAVERPLDLDATESTHVDKACSKVYEDVLKISETSN